MTSAELCRPPSARTITRPITLKCDQLTKAETLTVAAIERGAPALVEAQSLVDRFQSIVRRKAEADLDPWLQDAGTSLIASFARGYRQGSGRRACCHHRTLVERPNEGPVNRLKLVKRQMYGRAKLDLLEARLIGAT